MESNNAGPQGGQSQLDTGKGVEMSMRRVKCFNCRHLAAIIVQSLHVRTRISQLNWHGLLSLVEVGTVENPNPWILAVTTGEDISHRTDGALLR